MADTPTLEHVIGGGVGPLPTDNPPDVDPPRLPSGLETLCHDVPIGRLVSVPHKTLPTFAATYLSVDIAFVRRESNHFVNKQVVATDYGFVMRGPFLVLAVQVFERPLTRHGMPFRYVSRFGEFGLPLGPWPLGRFQVAPGVDLADLLDLADLVRLYNLNMVEIANVVTMVRFIPREHERELRDIAARLASNARERARDIG